MVHMRSQINERFRRWPRIKPRVPPFRLFDVIAFRFQLVQQRSPLLCPHSGRLLVQLEFFNAVIVFRRNAWFSQNQFSDWKILEDGKFVLVGAQIVPEFDEHIFIFLRQQLCGPNGPVHPILLSFDFKELLYQYLIGNCRTANGMDIGIVVLIGVVPLELCTTPVNGHRARDEDQDNAAENSGRRKAVARCH